MAISLVSTEEINENELVPVVEHQKHDSSENSEDSYETKKVTALQASSGAYHSVTFSKTDLRASEMEI